ncbi:hypothetical protein G3I37_04565 [Streptomyces anulatus]|uniref:Integrase n=1 Tax=Streptomyces anulatus TaxID=1892 RepID=A0A7K3RJN3_STRAQ|nr:hypothetical protein [Streptomyces anulatus]NED24183.1 hypothetical protein [Streptomyces anulatus]
MSRSATALLGDGAPTGLPEGTEWPGPDTLVLLHRECREGTDRRTLSRFGDDRWILTPAIFEDHTKAVSLNFRPVQVPWRLEVKHYVWQLLNLPRTRSMRHSRGERISPLTVSIVFPHLKAFVRWLHQQQLASFAQITPAHLDRYLDHLRDAKISLDLKYRRVGEVRRLWAHREVLPPFMRLPAAPPWNGEDPRDLFEKVRPHMENRTPRIDERTMQTLLVWALRFVEDFATDIMSAHTEHTRLHELSPELIHRPAGRQKRGGYLPGQLRRAVIAYLDKLYADGGHLPGHRSSDGELQIDWRHIERLFVCSAEIRRNGTGRLIIESGLPINPDIPMDASVTGLLDGNPWRTSAIGYHEAPRLARLLSTACFIVIAYLSGARPGEVLSLRRGCLRKDPETGLLLMGGLCYKNAVDADGNKIPQGEERADPWVVVAPVARAVEVLEKLHSSELLFPTYIESYRRPTARLGTARDVQSAAEDITGFTQWVNAYCARIKRPDAIPDDRHGTLSPSRFRRTLAWFIRRRPRGLVAAAIQYGHVHVQMLQGYAGSYDSGFPDEYAFEDWLYRMETLAEDARALAAGEHVSGPAADAYRHRVTGAHRTFAGRVLTSAAQSRDLLGNPLLQIHHGPGMTCVLNPATAPCQLRGSADDPLVTPDIDDCRPQCPNLARTDRDIAYNEQQVAELEETLSNSLAPPIRHARERHELARLQAILDAHHQKRKPT